MKSERKKSSSLEWGTSKWGLCEYIIVHTKLPPSPVILWIELGGKLKWLQLSFAYNDVMHTGPADTQNICLMRKSNIGDHVEVTKNTFLTKFPKTDRFRHIR